MTSAAVDPAPAHEHRPVKGPHGVITCATGCTLHVERPASVPDYGGATMATWR